MPSLDITKCLNDKCELKDCCWRWLAPAIKYWQSYNKFEPIDNKCEYFYEYNNKPAK